MISSSPNQTKESTRPFCQATGCFDHADVYVVVKETEEPDYYDEVSKESGYERVEKESQGFDGFKMILYLCSRHDGEFKYLVHGSELRVAKRCCLVR